MWRALIATVLLALAAGEAAHAHELRPSWGYAYIDDHPFLDVTGTPLGATQVNPRGRIRDTFRDERDVRLTVSVFVPGVTAAVHTYRVEEGDFLDKTIERQLDLAPNQPATVRYDFCRFNPSNGAVEVCEPPLLLNRPAPPAPPTPVPLPPPDADGDGFPVPADCWDQNVTVHPGAKELPGNGIDDDCAGGDAPGRVLAAVKNDWVKAGRRFRVRRMRVVDAPEGARVEVRCHGRRCPFKRHTRTVDARGEARLLKFFKRGVRPKVTIDVRVTYPNMVGRLIRFPVKNLDRVPSSQRYCLPPGAKRQRC